MNKFIHLAKCPHCGKVVKCCLLKILDDRMKETITYYFVCDFRHKFKITYPKNPVKKERRS